MPQSNGGGPSGPYGNSVPPPPPPPAPTPGTATYPPDLALEDTTPAQRKAIGLTQLAFARDVSALAAASYSEMLRILGHQNTAAE